MAQTESKIRLIFDGAERGVAAAAAKAKAAVRGLGDESGKAARSVDTFDSKVSGLANRLGSVGTVAGLFGAAMGAGGAAVGAALPLIGSLGLQLGVAKAAFSGSEKALDAYNKALEDGKGDFSEYNKLLKEMTPEQRAFTEAVVRTKKPLSDLQKTAGRSFLPGVTKFLDDSQSLFPIFDRAVERTGKIMSGTASQLGDLFKSEDFQQSLDDMLQSSDRITQAIGDNFVKLTAKLIDFGGNMDPAAEGFATFLDDMEAGLEGFLSGLEPHANDFKSIWESLGSILRDVLPIVGELAGEMSANLAPILRDVAGFIRENKDEIREWVPFIADAVVALAGLKLALKVKDAATGLIGIGNAIFGVGDKAKGADGKVGGLATRLGGLKAVAGGIALGAVAVGMDKVNEASEQGNLSGWNGELHDIARILTGDWGNPIADINAQLDQVNQKWEQGQAPVQKWAGAVGQAATDAAESMQNFFRGLVGLPPITLDVNTDPATGKVDEWVGGVSRRRGTAEFDANPELANAKLGGWVGSATATSARATLDAEPGRAYGQLDGWVGGVSRTRGTAHLDAEPSGADRTTAGWKSSGDRTTAQAHLSAEDSAADRVARGFYNSWAGRVITMSIRAITSVFGATGGAVTGGLIVPGFAPGGPVRGPGSGTSDDVLARLSNGEYVMTAAQVRAAGGFGGMAKIAAALSGGSQSGDVAPMRASAAAAMRTPPAVAASSGPTRVELVAAPGADQAVSSLIMRLVREQKVQARVA